MTGAVYAIADAGALGARGAARGGGRDGGGGHRLDPGARQASSPGAAGTRPSRAAAGRSKGAASALWVDDRADLAALFPVAGLHVGQRDLPPAAARRVVGRRRADRPLDPRRGAARRGGRGPGRRRDRRRAGLPDHRQGAPGPGRRPGVRAPGAASARASRWSPSAASTPATWPRCWPPGRTRRWCSARSAAGRPRDRAPTAAGCSRRPARRGMRIYLTGFMGCGKTTVGRRLAQRLGVAFVDLDEEIERRAGMTVREIFEQQGEPVFRQMEAEALRGTLALPDVVVATGGGTMAFEANAALIGANGLSVWLNPPFATIASRIGGRGKADRPLFKDESQALALYRERLPAYRRADLTMDVAPDEGPEEIAARIALLIGESTSALSDPLGHARQLGRVRDRPAAGPAQALRRGARAGRPGRLRRRPQPGGGRRAPSGSPAVHRARQPRQGGGGDRLRRQLQPDRPHRGAVDDRPPDPRPTSATCASCRRGRCRWRRGSPSATARRSTRTPTSSPTSTPGRSSPASTCR